MGAQEALVRLSELKVILDRIAETDTTLYEALAHDVDEALAKVDECIEELSPDDE